MKRLNEHKMIMIRILGWKHCLGKYLTLGKTTHVGIIAPRPVPSSFLMENNKNDCVISRDFSEVLRQTVCVFVLGVSFTEPYQIHSNCLLHSRKSCLWALQAISLLQRSMNDLFLSNNLWKRSDMNKLLPQA